MIFHKQSNISTYPYKAEVEVNISLSQILATFDHKIWPVTPIDWWKYGTIAYMSILRTKFWSCSGKYQGCAKVQYYPFFLSDMSDYPRILPGVYIIESSGVFCIFFFARSYKGLLVYEKASELGMQRRWPNTFRYFIGIWCILMTKWYFIMERVCFLAHFALS